MSSTAERWDAFYQTASPYAAIIESTKIEMDRCYEDETTSMYDRIDTLRAHQQAILSERKFFNYMTAAQIKGIDPVVAKLAYDGGAE